MKPRFYLTLVFALSFAKLVSAASPEDLVLAMPLEPPHLDPTAGAAAAIAVRGSSRLAAIVQQRPNWQFTTYSTGALPHFELPARFNADLQAFLSKA